MTGLVSRTHSWMKSQLQQPYRLTYDDDLFIRAEKINGVTLLIQCAWEFDSDVDHAQLHILVDRLRKCFLSRTAVHHRLLGARDAWSVNPAADLCSFSSERISPADIPRWREMQLEELSDPFKGPMWSTRAVHLTGGGTAFTVNVLHACTDGAGGILAVTRAVMGDMADPIPEGLRRDGKASLLADIVDSIGQVRLVFKNAAEYLRRRSSEPPVIGPGGLSSPEQSLTASARHLTTRHSTVDDNSAFIPPFESLVVRTDDWKKTAKAVNGTSTSLIIAFSLLVLRRAGRISNGDTVKVSVPVNRRDFDDVRANATTGIPVMVNINDDLYSDHSAIVAEVKAQREKLMSGHSNTMDLAAPIQQFIPRFLFRRLADNAKAPVCVASSLGTLPEAFTTLNIGPTQSVTVRVCARGTTRAQLIKSGGGLATWINSSGEKSTLAVTGLDPVRFPDKETLTALMVAELTEWGLSQVPRKSGAGSSTEPSN